MKVRAHRRDIEPGDRAKKLDDSRMDRTNQLISATAKLLRECKNLLRGMHADTRELKRSQKAFLDSLRIGGNGRGHAR